MIVFTCIGGGVQTKPDVLIEPKDDNTFPKSVAGNPYLVPGQTIDIGIVKFKANEQPPTVANSNNPLSLVDGEAIAKSATGRGFPLPLKAPFMLSGDHILLYYVASSPEQKDTFFRHGIYVLNTATELGRATIPNAIPIPVP